MRKVFVNGTFDVLHPGHFALLQHAKGLTQGGVLWVAIDTDERVRELKGPTRPIFNLEDRTFMLLSIRCVNVVRYFSTDLELEALVKDYEPDIMIVGSDWKGKKVIGSEYAKELRFYDRVGDYSTTKILQGLTDR